ncbi:C1 family peptidase [Paenibacillus sp. TAB 01]|uniref:C1 family peptidase n=1 Tax=Paenibacillus sp. TAB 01 TaxID=3368988 RepID=UPI0037515406
MRQYLLKIDLIDQRDFIYKVAAPTALQLPEEVDLRPLDTDIMDQGSLGSCTANAILGLKQFLDKRRDNYYFYLSRLYLYWHERALHGWENEDSGAFIRDGMKILATQGCARESFYPYSRTDYKHPPSAEAEADAGNYKITEYRRVLTFEAIQQSLAEGFPVVAGMDVYSAFESSAVGRTGVVPMPKNGEQYLGSHAVLVVGYKKINGSLYAIMRNSWGVNWGDKGYFYLPKDYFTAYVQDMWTAR